MILPIILHHNNSEVYTKELVERIKREYHIIDSSLLKTPMCHSFNLALNLGLRLSLKNSDITHLMICNNDISLDESSLEKLDTIIKGKTGIFSPALNSPHPQMMTPKNKQPLREVKWLEFVCPIFSLDVVKKVGLLDSNLSLGFGIDWDYCYRARLKNFKSFLVQSVKIEHYEHKSQENQKQYEIDAHKEMREVLSKKYGENWEKLIK